MKNRALALTVVTIDIHIINALRQMNAIREKDALIVDFVVRYGKLMTEHHHQSQVSGIFFWFEVSCTKFVNEYQLKN